jgi:hypothetical protein
MRNLFYSLTAAFHLRTAYKVPIIRSLRIGLAIVHRPFWAIRQLEEHAPELAIRIKEGLLCRTALMGLGGTVMPSVPEDDSWSLRGRGPQ